MSFSLDNAIRTCKIETGYANRVESSRFLDPANMLCPLWNGLDTTGRPVNRDSFVTLTAGCNSALSRAEVENELRPKYYSYVGLNACGLVGGGACDSGSTKPAVAHSRAASKHLGGKTANFGLDLGASVYPTTCSAGGMYPSTVEGTASNAQHHRNSAALVQGYKGANNRRCSGN
jgi:hypothetical protein